MIPTHTRYVHRTFTSCSKVADQASLSTKLVLVGPVVAAPFMIDVKEGERSLNRPMAIDFARKNATPMAQAHRTLPWIHQIVASTVRHAQPFDNG